ncbi:hypothetical protein [Pseudomonas bananamidigenes]|uniref:hypothetical protein n=1 Tax=Pseudomonas bananamidigenes TaxID=2843610 RepID=UPI000802D957|nr:hypothetical protein [Pseudomonas bananamidigenes]
MSISIQESGMNFGPYSQDKCFPIETSPLFTRLGKGLKVSEFVLLRNAPDNTQAAWFIEAKSSAPQEHAIYVEEIRQKFTNSVQLTFAACLKRHEDTEDLLPLEFRKLNLGKCSVKCVLVIRNFRKEWIAPLQESLNREMRTLIKTMGFSPASVVVINDEKARELNLIT